MDNAVSMEIHQGSEDLVCNPRSLGFRVPPFSERVSPRAFLLDRVKEFTSLAILCDEVDLFVGFEDI
jgi:hypothetical protein